MSVSISGSTPLSNTAATAAASQKDASKAGGANQDSSSQITNQVTITNPDGSTTTVITYADGTTSTTTQKAPAGQSANAAQPTQAGQPAKNGLLDTTNIGQNAALLAAQEKATAPA